MTTLSGLRASLKSDLGDVSLTVSGRTVALQLYTVLPEKVAPPCLFAGPDTPYVEFDDVTALGERKVNLKVDVIAPAGANDVAADQLDELIAAVIARLEASDDFTLDQVDEPGRITLNGQTYLGATVRLHTYSTLQED